VELLRRASTHSGVVLKSMVRSTSPEGYSNVVQNVYQTVADYESTLSGAANAKVKLNLGSSDVLLKGFINVDIVCSGGRGRRSNTAMALGRQLSGLRASIARDRAPAGQNSHDE
jgi:hypothetical protein